MKKILLLLLICITKLSAQNANSVWVFGDSAGINFSNLNNPLPIISGMDGRGSCASIADSMGNLLFYAFTRVGGTNFSTQIFNVQNQIMQNGDTIVGEGWYNELTIIPKPGNNHLYYLFSMGEVDIPSQGFWYSIIDMNANGGLGAVTQKNMQLNNFRNADCITAIKHGNDRDWWLFSKYSNTSGTMFNRFYTYLVTPDSIFNPIIQNFNNATDADVQRIIFNSTGTKMMQINSGGFMCEYDFDRCTGIISNPNIIYPEQTVSYDRLFWSGAYSSDDSKFYISTENSGNVTTNLLQYDLTAPNIPASVDTLLTSTIPVISGTVRLAPDNKIYFTCNYYWGFPGFPYPDTVYNQYNMNLGVINSPDSLGAACNFQPFSFNLGGERTYYGLPNNPNYELGALSGSPCDTLTGVQSIEFGVRSELFVYYHSSWQTAFINAERLRGRSYKMEVYDVVGKVIYREEGALSTEYYTKDLNCTAFAKGMYIVSLQTDKERLVKKFVKE